MKAWLPLALLAAEVLLVTVLRGSLGPYVSPLIVLLLLLAIGITPLALRNRPSMQSARWSSKQRLHIGLFLWVATVAVLTLMLGKHFATDPAPFSDVIPQAMTLAERVIDGRPVYAPIDFGGYVMAPTYLPFQFLPFTLSVWTGIDPRWIAFGVWSAVALVFQFWLAQRRQPPVIHVSLSLLPAAMMMLLIASQPESFRLSFETMIAGYYWLLAMALTSRKLLPLVGALLLCALSRYSLVLWLPLLFLVLFTHVNRRRTMKAAAGMVIGVVVIYIAPFLITSTEAFQEGYNYHLLAAKSLWSWAQTDNTAWNTIFTGLGMAPWFFTETGNRVAQLGSLQTVHWLLSGAVVVGLGTYFYTSRRKPNLRTFLLCGLMIYLAIFYGFIHLPFAYLFMVPMFVSLVVVANQYPTSQTK